MPVEARLSGQIDLAGFRSEARQLLAQQVPPDSVTWTAAPVSADVFQEPQPPSASRPRSVARAATAIVPASFLRLCESVVLHRDPARFSLLYRLLWRLVHEPTLRNDAEDRDMLQAQHMAHAVRRDIHKLKSHLRFVSMPAPPGREPASMQVAWFEPAHHIVEFVAPWFAKRVATGPWVILTPQRSVCWDGERMLYGRGIARDRWPPDEYDTGGWFACVDAAFRRD